MTVDTIFAPATARGRAGVAIVRLSGPRAATALTLLAGRLPAARRATRAALRSPPSGPGPEEGGEVLDDALVLWFPAPASFTGEDVAELHIHGGRAVLAAVLGALGDLPGLRPAEAGEFSRRAFLNGRLDLTAAEALADLVDAETQAQRRQALRQADGALVRLYEGWRTTGIGLLAHLEAVLDFPDEDLPPEVETAVRRGITALADALAGHLDDRHRGERLRDGLQVAVVGAPNVGKSSLVNRLARREAAIVSDIAGTTRDIVEVALDLGGYPLVVADTAGLRETSDGIEAEGVRRARARLAAADLTLAVSDGAVEDCADDPAAALTGGAVLRVVTKRDLIDPRAVERWLARGALPVSTLTGEGLDALEAALESRARAFFEGDGTPALTRQRHRSALMEARAALRRAAEAPLAELVAEDLRLALRAIGRITGRVTVDDVLDVIFRDFCIGK
ncbi:tRNA uridine-5-carboxymethylaminomethyl(34) synthesis GTPase MnmE [Rhodospirillum rubrum]|uniref:tRNA uridine-5-carboxymethylaminomethyl(34) synthesis GTPase MnmE n=1 Tax=Rhodospirillum rubrum TaxID=1085 RepID=UPI001904AF4C|nr:tRNA uridine-5-carboxymethylaminomethyl(34) synthesis GTPase MnmE [Rhodospirillum rubrum]MBK1663230.1 tRNA uridine-5-carboxymethylaminomethyl(34) synthesis GTPase MnmE [Rhodospirillum rubrum]MBK1676209.1 tRNA uridine-5-carboxymethylaminomethyl(34) synthesis GTPase MnmE [Rhodospirillum rubrum]